MSTMQTSTVQIDFEEDSTKYLVAINSLLYNTTQEFKKSDSKYFYLYDNLANKFLIWYLPLVISIGLVGTAFCLAFLFLSKLFPRSLLLWLVSICIGDFMILSWDGVWMALKVWWRFDIRDQGNAICKIHTFFSNYFLYWSAYMQACMSLQRLYLIVRPLQARTELPFRRLFIAWLVCSLALVPPHVIYFRWNIEVNNDCDPPDPKLFRITSLCDLIILGLIPMISMILSTGVISWKVIRFQTNFPGGKRDAPSTSASASSSGAKSIYSRIRSLSRSDIHRHTIQQSTSLNLPSSMPTTGTSPIPSSASCGEANCGRRHGGSDNARHVTKLLITMNLWYMVTTFPYLIYLIHLNFVLHNEIPGGVHRFWFYFLRSLCYLNSCSNWFFYCAAGRVFRKRAKRILYRLLCCRKGAGRMISEPMSGMPPRRDTVVTPPIRMVLRLDANRSLQASDYNLKRRLHVPDSTVHQQQSPSDVKIFPPGNGECTI